MTDKQKIKQYIYIKEEIADLEQRIKKDKEKLLDLENSMVTDSVTCGKKGKKPIRSVKISGFPSNEYSKRRAFLQGRIIARERYKTQQEEIENNIEEYVQSIEDAKIRLIIRYKYIDDMEWDKVAAKIGGDNSGDSLRMLLERYLKKN